MSGSGPIYEYQRELTAKLEQVTRERDEARAEAERLRADNADLLARLDAAAFAVPQGLRDVAERQREECAVMVTRCLDEVVKHNAAPNEWLQKVCDAIVEKVRTTTLVTARKT